MKKIILLGLSLLMGIGFFGCTINFPTVSHTTDATSSNIISSDTTNTTEQSAILTVTDTTDSVSTDMTTEEEQTTYQTTTDEITTIEERFVDINLFSINDFHGGAYSDIENLEYIGGYLKFQRSLDPDTIILGAGDIFQGTALSNYYHGLPIVDVFNNIGFDGFVIGNHEFDWGIEEITAYRDGDTTNGEMEYPLLAANIVYEDSGDPLENTVPYIIKDVQGVKVGIIGVIGDVIDSISASRTENMVFLDAVDTVSQYAETLRVDEGCDVIVVYAHEGSYIDTSIANLTGNHYVNAIFNAHTHQNEHGTISRSTGVAMPYAQASNSEYSLFSRITLTYDREAGEVTASSSSIKSLMDVSYNSDSSIADILYQYDNDVDYRAFVDQVLAHTDTSYSSSALAKWGASVIRDYTGVDVGALNRGGFRVTMPAGDVTMADLITVYPFDNYIKTCEMTGAELTDLYESLSSTDVVFDDSLSYSSGTLYINGIPVQNNGTYTIGAVDYIFDKDYYPFMYGDNIQTTTYLMRDLLAEDLGNTTGTFNPYDGTSASLSTFIFEPVIVLRSDFGLIN